MQVHRVMHYKMATLFERKSEIIKSQEKINAREFEEVSVTINESMKG